MEQQCTFFTWNLGGNNVDASRRATAAFERAIKHLAEAGTCIAAFQEVPNSIAMDAALVLSDGRIRIVAETHQTKVLLLHSEDIRGVQISCEARMCGATFGGDLWGNIQVLGVHLDSREYVEHSEGERSRWTGAFLNFWRGGPLVVLGDFNSNPYEPTVCARDPGFYALRDRDIVEYEVNKRSHHRTPLYNPMWRHLQEKKADEARGTNTYGPDASGNRACLYDQILVSIDLKDSLEDPIICHEIDGFSLITKQDGRSCGGYPQSSVANHLPVKMHINLKR